MSYLSEAHQEWHTVHGKYEVCPLDCGANEYLYDDPSYHDPDYDPDLPYSFSQWERGMMPV